MGGTITLKVMKLNFEVAMAFDLFCFLLTSTSSHVNWFKETFARNVFDIMKKS